MQRFAFPLLCLLALSAQAHEGHGIEGASITTPVMCGDL
jgi:hypothetical protein